jgi:hypothetical protein
VNQILKVCGPPRSTRLKAEEGDENAVDADGLGLRQVADIAANHGEVHIARGKLPGSLKRSTGVNHLEADRRPVDTRAGLPWRTSPWHPRRRSSRRRG